MKEVEDHSDANDQETDQESSHSLPSNLEELMNHRIQEAVLAALREQAKELRADSRTESSESRTLPPEPKKSMSNSSSGSTTATTSTVNVKLSDSAKYYLKQIQEYNGTGGPQKFYAYVESFEEFSSEIDDLPSHAELKFATSKLTGDARMWWRKHRETHPNDSAKRILTWKELKQGLMNAFVPPEHARIVREKLRTIKQKGSVTEYNALFTRLAMQLQDLSFAEASFDYLQGLKPEIRNLVQVKDDISDLETLQNACVKLDIREKRYSNSQDEALSTDSNQRGRGNFRPNYSRGYGRGTPSSRGQNYGPQQNYRGQGRGYGRGYTQGHQGYGYRPRYDPNTPTNTTTAKCDLCDKTGHIMRNCPKLQDAKDAVKEQVNLACGVTTIIDSGATQHMFNDLGAFDEVYPQKSSVACANSQELESTHIGTVTLNLDDDDEKNISLQNVLYIPKLRHNLLSVPALNQDGKDIHFLRDGMVTMTDANTTYDIGHSVGNLRYLSNSPEAYNTTSTTKEDDYHLWHHRLGHPGSHILDKISDYVIGLDKLKKSDNMTKVCEACVYAKSHRQPFPKMSTNRAEVILERIHSDLCGPMPVESLKGSRYILTFIDDASRYAHVYFLEKKSETFDTFVKFKTRVERETGNQLKVLRSDGGGEYISKVMEEYFTKNGIRHETTAAYSPEQNGVAERYNRTLLECTRALMHSAGIPNKLWAEIAGTAAYLRNRLPTQANENKTPYEMYHGKKPDISHLRVIWAEAYANIPKAKQTTKLSARATKLKLVGYHEGKKAYRLWDPIKEQLEISRDVIFDESTVLQHHHILPNIDCDDEEYIIERIIDERTTDGNREFLIKWADYDVEEATWEPFENISEAQALDEWEQRRAEALITDVTEALYVEPWTYKEAIASGDAPYWKEAIGKELESLEKNNTFTIVNREVVPPGRTPIGCKWVFKRKMNPDGTIDKYKARLVAKGYSQQPGVDFYETFAPAAKLTTIRVILSIAAILDLHVHHMDVKSAFLNGDLEEELYMELPEGLDDNLNSNKVYRLNRSIYGLKQASRMWYQKLKEYLVSQGFVQINSDHTVFIRHTSENSLDIIDFHVDDLMIAAKSITTINEIKRALATRFEMTDGGELRFFLGIQVERDRAQRTLALSQGHFVEQILRRFQMQDCKPVSTPLDTSVKLQGTGTNDELTNKRIDPTFFRQIIGSLMYLMLGTRPDLAAAVSIISQFSANLIYRRRNGFCGI